MPILEGDKPGAPVAAPAPRRPKRPPRGGPTQPTSRGRSYRGVTLDDYTLQMLQQAEAMVGPFSFYQGSYSTSVAASEGTHAGGGVFDVDLRGRSPEWIRRAIDALGQAGFTVFNRSRSDRWPAHLHVLAPGDPDLSPAARRQAAGGPQGTVDRGSLTGQLALAGFAFPFDIKPYVDKALRSGLTGDSLFSYLYAQVVRSPEFHTAFPGIFRSNGTLRMAPPEYLARREALQSVASQYGFTLSNWSAGQAISQDRDPTEFEQIAKAVQTIRTNPQVYRFLAAETGVKSVREAVAFLISKSDATVYSRYEAASLQAAATSAGVTLSPGRAREIAARTPGMLGLPESEQSFQKIADELRTAGPELSLYGVNQRDLEILEFGGPDRAKIAKRAEQALRQRQAALQTVPGAAVGLLQGRPVLQTGQTVEPGL